MVLAAHFIDRVADSGQEVFVGVDDGAVKLELDDRLRLADRARLALEFGGGAFLRGDVGGELDDLVGLAVGVHDRVVGGVDPDFAAILGHARVFAAVVFAGGQLGPEGLVGRRGHVGRLAEHRMVLALHLGQRVAQRAQEIVVGVQDGAVEFEFDHGLHPVQGVVDRFQFQIARLGCGDALVHGKTLTCLACNIHEKFHLELFARHGLGQRSRSLRQKEKLLSRILSGVKKKRDSAR
jgi:hypothetical protein